MISKASKIFFAGIVIASFVSAFGFLNTNLHESKVHKLESECAEEWKQDKSKLASEVALYGGTLVCDAQSLSSGDGNVGIQAKIVQAQNEVLSSKEWPYFAALLVLIFSAVPWAWYFLLRRIREVRDAVAGK